jgi:hypothetical protein
MKRLLVVANRTVDSEELLSALEARAAEDPIAVTLLIPACWEVTDPHGGRQSALRRLRAARDRLAAAGIAVVEVLGDADPLAAVEAVWDPERFDEVVVATLPARVSRWLGMDLPRRVERLTGLPVRHVVAHARDAAIA